MSNIYKYPAHRTISVIMAKEFYNQKGHMITFYDLDTRNIVEHFKKVRTLN